MDGFGYSLEYDFCSELCAGAHNTSCSVVIELFLIRSLPMQFFVVQSQRKCSPSFSINFSLGAGILKDHRYELNQQKHNENLSRLYWLCWVGGLAEFGEDFWRDAVLEKFVRLN